MTNGRLVRSDFHPLLSAKDDYLLALESEGRSPKTLAIYGFALRRFAQHAGPIEPAEVKPVVLRAWLKAMADEGLSVTSQRDYLRAVKSWITWLAAEDAYGITQQQQQQCRTRVQPPPEDDDHQPIPYSPKEVAALYAACGRRGWIALRATALVSLLLDTGIRASELCGLTLADVDLAEGTITVRAATSKVRRTRTIALGRRAKRDMGHWWARKRHLLDVHDDARWFCTGISAPLTPRSLLQIVSRLGTTAGVEHCHPHRFRHTAAIEGLRAGMTPFAVMRMLGHTDLTMTRRYVKYLDADMNNEKRTRSPLDHLRVRG